MSGAIIITSSDLRPGCRDLALLRRKDPAVQMPAKSAIRMGSMRHEVRRECWRRRFWPPTLEQLASVAQEAATAFQDLSTEERELVSEQMVAALRTPDLWPPRSAVLAMEDWMPGIAEQHRVMHRGEPGWDVLIGFLPDGTEVHLRSRFDLVGIDESDVAVGVITDTKGAGGDYTYQAQHNALGASVLWDGIPRWRYQAVYLSSDRRPQVIEYDGEALALVRQQLLAEAARIAEELTTGSAEATPGDDCDWCPKRKTCAAAQRALTPLSSGAPAAWPTPAELPTLPTPELLAVFARFEPGKGLVDDYWEALRSAIKTRMEAEKLKRLIDEKTSSGLAFSEKSGGHDVASMAAFVAFVAKHGLKLDECAAPRWTETAKALRKIADQRVYETAVAELEALKVPKKRVTELRSIKDKAAARLPKEA